ncbi:DUF255 domain-containing protein [Alisedimentitalea sp. MJ-SS2]|nr:DUF255 domain-containing protein [Alisedimentitalea sp. MJ-SS2]
MRIVTLLLTLLLPITAMAENRLARESSLYLRQHADQPVDWHPWGQEALDMARKTGKPIFISVGYAACHWCHVMAEESFDNPAIAEILNSRFISIKIDRERRPDLDEQFMLVTSALTGTAGWPNSVFLTPDGAPYYAGGYFPPDDFAQLLVAVDVAWQSDREEVLRVASELQTMLRGYLDGQTELRNVSSEEITKAALNSVASLDEFNGGFGTGLKFPRESFLLFLLDQAARHGQSDLLNAVTLTLDGMIRGGIHDHVGGGFHRYAIDPEWLTPHFEKMLYNQALMARVLLRAYVLNGNNDYSRTATRTLDYVLRDMRGDEGMFFTAQDADTILPTGEREEGRFYVWTPEEITAALNTDAVPFMAAFNIIEDGLFEGRNIPNLGQSPLETAALLGLSIQEFDSRLERLRIKRAARTAPVRDEKIILSWNAEMIATLAEAATILDRPDYLAAAETAALALLKRLASEDRLHRVIYDDVVDVPAQLADYAALGRALLALHDHGSTATDWLSVADPLAGAMQTLFADPDQPMRMTETAAGLGPLRPLDDNEIASGNALALGFVSGLDRRMTRTGDFAPRLAALLAARGLERPDRRSAILTALETDRLGPATPLRVSSGGAVNAVARVDRTTAQLLVDIALRDGWHLNAHTPLEDYLIGVSLDVDGTPLTATTYPAPVTRSLGFSAAPLALYENDFALTAPLDLSGDTPKRATLILQACNDEQCLPPDEMVFWFW